MDRYPALLLNVTVTFGIWAFATFFFHLALHDATA